MSDDVAAAWPLWEIWRTGRESMSTLEKWPYRLIMQAYEVVMAEQRQQAKQIERMKEAQNQ